MTKTNLITELKALSFEDQKEVVDIISKNLKDNELTHQKEALKKKLSEMVDNGTLSYHDYSYVTKPRAINPWLNAFDLILHS
jgi:hypothetical protein